MAMYETIGTNDPTYLLADPNGAEVIAVGVKPGSGTVKRGTVLYRDSTGMYCPAATGDIVVTKYLVVLDETVDAGSTPGEGIKVVAEDARAYRAGHFVSGKVTLKADGAITEAHKVVLRMQGILFDKMEDTATVDNTVTGA